MGRLFAVLLYLLVAAPAFAQDVFPPRQTPAPDDARFAVLSGSYSGGPTYRLDRWTGQITELNTQQPTPTWQACEYKDGAPDASSSRPRYQLVTTGLFSGEILLVDTLTTHTWIRTIGEEMTPGRKDYRSIFVLLK